MILFWKPVHGNQDVGDVGTCTGSSQQPTSSVLNKLQVDDARVEMQ